MSEPKDMSFLEHLEELRGRLFKAVLGMLAGIILIIVFHDFVVKRIVMGPTNPDFPTYAAFCSWSHKMGMGDKLCLSAPECLIQSTTMSGGINADILVCIIGGLIVGFPWVFWQFWSFIKPGLKKNEVSAVRGVVIYVSLLFFVGVAFSYFILAPLSVQFLCGYTFADVPQQPTLLSYLKLTTSLVLGTGLVFQLPVLVYFLTKIGMVSSKFLKKYRKHAFVANLILAAIITPPDVTSQLLVAMPILLLYELSILIAKRVEKRKAMAVA